MKRFNTKELGELKSKVSHEAEVKSKHFHLAPNIYNEPFKVKGTDTSNDGFHASAEIRVELYKIGLLRTINIYFLVIETFLNNVI